jgi:hypothetical protein
MELNNPQSTSETTGPSIVITSRITPRTPRARKEENQSEDTTEVDKGRTPRITKLMALAIHLQRLINDGVVHDCADIARLAGLTRARISQIMNLTLLAPSIQEDILLMPRIHKGHDPITERHLRIIALIPDWDKQAYGWKSLTEKNNLV